MKVVVVVTKAAPGRRQGKREVVPTDPLSFRISSYTEALEAEAAEAADAERAADITDAVRHTKREDCA